MISHEAIEIMDDKNVTQLVVHRIYQGLTQVKVQELIGMSQPQITQAEKVKNAPT